jgi:hypothetical protein
MNGKGAAMRLSYVAYWLLFVGLTALGGDNGFNTLSGTDRESASYPYVAVVVISLLIGVATAGLYMILNPVSPTRSWPRLLAGLAYTAILAILAALMFVTHLASAVYAIHAFAFVSFLLMLIWCAAAAGHALWRKVTT